MKALGLQEIEVAKIDLGKRLRPISPVYAAMIAENIERTGRLRMPIEVRVIKGGRYKLVAGGHRFSAVESLKQKTIQAFVFDCSDDEALILEIDENMVRRNLDALDESAFLLARKEAWERLHPETKHGAQGGRGGRRNENDTLPFSLATAEKIGRNRRTIERLVQIGKGLTPEARKALAGTRLANNHGELRALSKMTASQQAKVVAGILSPEPKWSSVRQASDAINNRVKKEVSRLDRAWLTFLSLPAREQRALQGRINGHLKLKVAAE